VPVLHGHFLIYKGGKMKNMNPKRLLSSILITIATTLLFTSSISHALEFPPDPLWSGETMLTNYNSDSSSPSSISDSQGRIFIVYEDNRGGDYEIRYSVIDSKTGAILISDDPLSDNDGKDSYVASIAKDDNDNMYVAWYQSYGGGRKVYYKKYDSASETWSPNDILVPNSSHYWDVFSIPQMTTAVDSYNNLHIIYEHKNTNTSPYERFIKHVICYSDGTFSTPATLSNTANLGLRPAAEISGNKLHVAWYESIDSSSSKTVYRQFSITGSKTGSWGPSEDVYAAYTAGSPDLAVDPDGNAYIAYFYRSAFGADLKIFASKRSSGGSYDPVIEVLNLGSANYAGYLKMVKGVQGFYIIYNYYPPSPGDEGTLKYLYWNGSSFVDTSNAFSQKNVYSYNTPSLCFDPRGNLNITYPKIFMAGGSIDKIEVSNFQGLLAPTITTIPGTGRIGEDITISGSKFNFDITWYYGKLTFNGIEAAPTSWSGNSITTPVPDGASTGPVKVSIYDTWDKLICESYDHQFTILPAIESITPSSGSFGIDVKITGNNFGNAQETVKFNGTTATDILSWTDSEIVVTVPFFLSTPGQPSPVVIEKADGFSNSAFYTTLLPAIDAVTPSSGPESSIITLQGTDFGGIEGIVTLSGVSASIISWTDTTITAEVPALSPGPAEIKVYNDVGWSNPYSFTVTQAPGQFDLILPNDGAWINTNIPDFIWTQCVDNGVIPSSYELYINGSLDQIIDPSSFTGNISATPISPLIEGSNSWYVTARVDANTYRQSETRSLSVDTAPPTISSIIYSIDAVDESLVTFTWNPADDPDPASGIVGYTLNISGQDPIDVGDVTSYQVNLGDGTYSAQVTAFDLAGNSGSSVSITDILVNVNAPTITVRIKKDGRINEYSEDRTSPPIPASPGSEIELIAEDANGIVSQSMTIYDISGVEVVPSTSSSVIFDSNLQENEIYIIEAAADDGTYQSSVTLHIQILSGDAQIINGIPYNDPNPFDPLGGTTIKFYLSSDVDTKVQIYNLVGKLVRQKTCIAGVDEGGKQDLNLVDWDGKDNFGNIVPNGAYFYFIIADGKVIGRGEMAAFR
jgi:hypothetical protein